MAGKTIKRPIPVTDTVTTYSQTMIVNRVLTN